MFPTWRFRPSTRIRKHLLCILIVVICVEGWLLLGTDRHTEKAGKGDLAMPYMVWKIQDENATMFSSLKALLQAYAYPAFVSWSPPDGPGEWGRGLNIKRRQLQGEERALFEDGWRRHHYNVYVSDRISVRRRLPDLRPQQCLGKRYPRQLPPVSVIICFYNEAWSLLLRTLHSVLARSPPALLQQVILVDDFSDLDQLGKPLEGYVRALGTRVQLVRTARREGLIRARLVGARAASAPVLVFLDSHCECFPGWLPPLVARVAEDWRIVPFPTILPISQSNFKVSPPQNSSRLLVGGFHWRNLNFRWKELSPAEQARRRSPADPARSPTMPGGLFAISRRWFQLLGEYDPNLEVWGAENMELSFKVWQCNGSVEVIPCSLVGHVFRAQFPAHYQLEGTAHITHNAAIVASVWMDHFRNYVTEVRRALYPDEQLPTLPRNVTSRLLLRKSLHCHDFRWYVENVYPDLFVPSTATHVGKIKNVAKSKCFIPLSSLSEQLSIPALFTIDCADIKKDPWYLLKSGELRAGDVFLCASNHLKVLPSCPGNHGLWNYTRDGHLHSVSRDLCVGMTSQGATLRLEPCTDTDLQRWILPARTWTPPPP